MKSKTRQFLTLLFLLTFSLEIMAAVTVSSDAGKCTNYHKVDVQKEKLSATSFLSEGNEETDDNKVRGLAVPPQVFTPYSDHSFVSKIKLDFQRSFDPRQNKQIILVICRLTI